MNGFIFKVKNQYYFIETDYTRKAKVIANKILDYLVNVKYANCGFIPLNVMQNTFNRIYNEMRLVDIQLSNDQQWYYIHEKYAGETIPITKLTIIKGGE